jgi:YHS domain-containing protein
MTLYIIEPDHGHAAGEPSSLNTEEQNVKEIDPVCKMEVEVETAQWISEYQGKTYYFCAPGCKASFDKDPEKYLQGGEHAGHHHHH